MISIEKIRAISSIACKDIVLDPEVESGWPYRATYTIYGDGGTGVQNDFQNILKSIEKYIKASASNGHKSLYFQLDYDVNDSSFYKRIIICAYIILFNGGYNVAVDKEHVSNFDPNQCQDSRIIDLFIKW